MPTTRNRGFTLIELAIVLVIIGLIVGGVLIGRDLIKNAEMRATIAQIEAYEAASNTFRSKFGGLPGDLESNKATQFGFTARSGAPGHGDGNGQIEGCAAASTALGCETALFWKDLFDASMIKEGLNGGGDDYINLSYRMTPLQQFATHLNPISDAHAMVGPPAGISASRSAIMPVTKSSPGNYVAVFSEAGLNYFQLTGVDDTDATGTYTLANQLSPAEAFMIDTKKDNGYPLSGVVQAMGGTGPLNVPAVPGAAACVYNVGTPNPYNQTTQAIADQLLCQLRIRISN